MGESEIRKLDALISQVYADISNVITGYDALMPVVDNDRFKEKKESVAELCEKIYLNGDFILKNESKEKERIAYAISSLSLTNYIENNGKGASYNPYVKGFATCIVLDTLGLLEKMGYDFSGFEDKIWVQMCETDASKVLKGRDAYRIIETNVKKKSWGVNWAMTILKYSFNENGEEVFDKIIQKEGGKSQKEGENELNDYLKEEGIASAVGELVKISSAKESLVKIANYQLKREPWQTVEPEMKKVADNIRKASNAELAKTFETLTTLFGGYLEFDDPFGVPKKSEDGIKSQEEIEKERMRREEISEKFRELADATGKFYMWAADYEKKEEILCFDF